MTEIKLTLEDPELFAKQLTHAAKHWDDGRATPIGMALHMVAHQIEEQLPKPPIEEPTGDVVVARGGWFFKPGGVSGWVRDDLKPFTWGEVVGHCGESVVYRNEAEILNPAESARLDGANADEDTRARLTEMLSTTVFHCFNGRKLGLSAMQAMAVADALVAAGARFDEVAS